MNQKMPDRYNRQAFFEAIRNPSMFFDEMRRLSRAGMNKVLSRIFYSRYGAPVDIMYQDWDNLIILDACRYDKFRKLNGIDGDLSKVVSPASHSDEYMISNFIRKELHDTVYISANPHTDYTLDGNIFHKIIKTYATTRHHHRKLSEHDPKTVADIAIENYENYKDKD